MKIYTFIVGFQYVPKNKLLEDILKMCLTLDKTSFKQEQLETFKNQFKQKMDKLHLQHPRAKRIDYSFYKHESHIHIHGIQSCAVTIYHGNLVDL